MTASMGNRVEFDHLSLGIKPMLTSPLASIRAHKYSWPNALLNIMASNIAARQAKPLEELSPEL